MVGNTKKSKGLYIVSISILIQFLWDVQIVLYNEWPIYETITIYTVLRVQLLEYDK